MMAVTASGTWAGNNMRSLGRHCNLDDLLGNFLVISTGFSVFLWTSSYENSKVLLARQESLGPSAIIKRAEIVDFQNVNSVN